MMVRIDCAWCGSAWEIPEEELKVVCDDEDRYEVKMVCPRCMKQTILTDKGV